MLTKTGSDSIIPIDAIRVQAIRAGLPWALTNSNIPPPIPTRVCVIQSGAASTLLTIQGPQRIRLGPDGCADATVGEYVFITPDTHVTCLPSDFTLRAAAKQTVEVSCTVDPQGPWQSPTAGYVTVAPLGENEWRIEGMELLSSHGRFEGTLRGVAPLFGLDVRALDGTHLLGPFSLAPKSLKGRVILDGRPVDVEFGR
jgi:hypothetical protein